MAKTALTIAIRYAARRRQFGPAPPAQETLLLDYAAAQRRLMPLLANVYAIDFAVKDLVALIAGPTGETTRASETLAAALKAWATWNTTRTIQICREICGGEGYIASNRFSVLKADSDVFVTFEGDNTVLMQLVAKNLLTDLKDKLKAMQPAKVTEFFVQKTLGELVRRLPLFTLNSSRYHLLEPAVQLNFFESRASRMLLQSATRFRRLAQKMDSYTAFTRLQPDLLDLAGAYIEHQVLKSFVAAIQRIPDGALRTALKKLCDLFALYHLEAHKGWYLENSFMSGLQTRAITKLVTGLCSEIRNDALAFVDAFGIPEALLDARIARKSAQ